MPNAILSQSVRRLALCAVLLPLLSSLAPAVLGQAQQKTTAPKTPQAGFTGGGEATLEADQQRAVGKTYYADGHVDVHYQNARLRADHVEYDSENQIINARGHVQLDYLTQHVEAEDARYEVRTGRGTFHHVRGTFALQRRPIPTLLISPNPLYFDAEEADRLDENTYRIRKAWVTVCDPSRPTWKFYAPKATVRLKKSVRIENGYFRLRSIPVVYLPYATLPAEQRRDSGFMIPDVGDTTQKGFVLGESVYWAPLDWLDLTLGGALYSSRGWGQKGQFRMRPWENTQLDATYSGVIDRGLPQEGEPPLKQGGHEAKMRFTSELPDGWRAVADLDQLTSLTYRLAWSETLKEAVDSEVRNTACLQKNFDGFSLGLAALSYRNYLSATPETSIALRTAPELRISSVDQAFFQKLPVYFSFGAFTGAESRSEDVTPFHTPSFVERSELAPSVTIPLHFGPWLNITSSFTFRSTYYGAQLRNGAFFAQGLFRDTEELSIDVRLPVVEKIWESGDTKWKHVIEPYVTYRDVNGVNDFGRFLRFDQDDTLTDTNELEYGITQRLFRRTGDDGAEEFITWRLAEKYFFDPTFGGALVPGQPNVFQTTDGFTPFAFADVPRHFSPIISDLKIEPGKRFDTQFIINYDPTRNRLTAIGELLKLRPYKEAFLTLSHFSVLNLPLNPVTPPPNFEQRSNQVRTLLGYGDPSRRGWNVIAGTTYDFTQQVFQNQIAEVSYNGSCCGIGFEFRRFSFGTIRNENQYSVVFRIANLGSVGNMRKQEKIF
ncbi:MAG TPA: LPS assembly protein LptD [Candidatus Acidoferrum sp.]|nr:LPS assembly protein LptD [Candidatus Acidoferrum sp.]